MQTKNHFSLYSPSEFRRAAQARRIALVNAAVLGMAFLIMLGICMALFAYQTDPRPVVGTKACVALQDMFEQNAPIVSWQSRGETDSYGKYLADLKSAQCKTSSLSAYMGW